MKAYSLDLRERIVRAVEEGTSQVEVARLFRVGERSVKRYVHQWRMSGTLAPSPRPGKRPAIGPDRYPAVLAQLNACPDATLAEHCDQWHEATGMAVSPTTWCRLERRIGWTHKKKSLIASEQDPAARAAWWEAMVDVPTERLVFVDETGTHTRMTLVYALAPRGQRAYGHVPRNHTRNTTPIAALTLAGLDAPMVIEGAMDREAFVAWLTHFLVPTLAPGRVVVMDNLSVHKGRRVRQIIEQAGCSLVGRPLGSIPTYSPDYSPIEGAYRKVKTLVRRAAKRTQGELEGAIGRAVEAVTIPRCRRMVPSLRLPPRGPIAMTSALVCDGTAGMRGGSSGNERRTTTPPHSALGDQPPVVYARTIPLGGVPRNRWRYSGQRVR